MLLIIHSARRSARTARPDPPVRQRSRALPSWRGCGRRTGGYHDRTPADLGVTSDIEPIGVGVVALVAVGAAVHHEDPRPRRQHHPTDVLIRGRHPGEVMNRCVQPKDLVEHARDQRAIAPRTAPTARDARRTGTPPTPTALTVVSIPGHVYEMIDRGWPPSTSSAARQPGRSAPGRASRMRLLDENTERLHTRADAMVHRAHHVEGRLCEVRQRRRVRRREGQRGRRPRSGCTAVRGRRHRRTCRREARRQPSRGPSLGSPRHPVPAMQPIAAQPTAHGTFRARGGSVLMIAGGSAALTIGAELTPCGRRVVLPAGQGGAHLGEPWEGGDSVPSQPHNRADVAQLSVRRIRIGQHLIGPWIEIRSRQSPEGSSAASRASARQTSRPLSEVSMVESSRCVS